MYPTIEDLKTIAESGVYRRIPVAREIYSDCFTPIEVMRTLRAASRHCYLLESAEDNQKWGRYSFLGCSPSLELTCRNGVLRIRRGDEDEIKEETISETLHPGEAIRRILEEYKSPKLENMPPFTGGLVGYFSYDYIKYPEPVLGKKDLENDDFCDVDLMLFDRVIVFDHYKQKLILIAGVDAADPEHSYAEAAEKLDETERLLYSSAKAAFRPLKLKEELTPVFTKEEYCRMVEKARHYIHEGDIFQVVLSDPLTAAAEGSLFDTYRVLRTTNPSPYMFYFSSDDVEIAGASPETLAKLQNQTLYNFPLAGTRPRGRDAQEDEALERELLSDEKELAEHNMLVDLGRNDLGRVCRLGTVKVDKYCSIERFSHVMHIGSTVSGTIRNDRDAVDAIDSILRPERSPERPNCGPVRLSENWRAEREASTEAPSAISI